MTGSLAARLRAALVLPTPRPAPLATSALWRELAWYAVPLAAYYVTFLRFRPGLHLAGDFLLPVVALAFVLIYRQGVLRYEGRFPTELRPVSIAGAGAGAALAVAGLAALLAAQVVALSLAAGTPVLPSPADLDIGPVAELLRSRAASAVVAAKEEILFRALLLRWMLGRMPVAAAIGAQAALFGAEHWVFGAASVLNATLIGLSLGVLYVATNNLWLVWGFHFAWDFAIYVLGGGFAAYERVLRVALAEPPALGGLASLAAVELLLLLAVILLVPRLGRLARPVAAGRLE